MILIADDNTDFRRTIRTMVEEFDAEVLECSDGGEAVEQYEIHRSEWVLMDINMRPLDGLSAMRTILERHPEARVVIVSQYQDVRTREAALAMGAYAFIGKENLMELRELIREEVGSHLTATER